MSLRLRKGRLVSVVHKKTAPYTGASGSLYRLEFFDSDTFQGLLLPPQRRVTRTAAGVRLAVTWALIPQGNPDVSEFDHLYFPDDPRAFVVTAIRRYPRHLRYDLELKQ